MPFTFENISIDVREKQVWTGSQEICQWLGNLTNTFHFLGLNSLNFQVKELELVMFKNLSSSDSKYACLSLGVNVRASQDCCCDTCFAAHDRHFSRQLSWHFTSSDHWWVLVADTLLVMVTVVGAVEMNTFYWSFSLCDSSLTSPSQHVCHSTPKTHF